MDEYLSQNKFAELIGVTPQAISAAVRTGRVHRIASGIDPEHPTNKHFARKYERRREERKRKKEREAELAKAKAKATKAKRKRAGKKKPKVVRKVARKIELEETPPEVIEEIKPRQYRQPKQQKKQLGTDNTEKHDTWLSRESAEHQKLLEQVRKLKVDTDEKRKQLIRRDAVRRVFGRLYTIDTNEFKTLGDKLTPEIVALCGIDDPDMQIKIGQLIEAECYRVLEHIRRLMNDFLIKVEADPIGEGEENDGNIS